MADIRQLIPFVVKWEGGYVNDPDDKGGATNMGVTLSTWKQVGYDKDGDGDIDAEDIKLLKHGDLEPVLRRYWNQWRADDIKNQSIANILVDWVWCSGKWGITIPQGLLALQRDGIVGSTTIKAVNLYNQQDLFNLIVSARTNYLNGIVQKNPKQKKFFTGWMNRLNDFKFY